MGDRQQPAGGGGHDGRPYGGRSHVTWEDGYGRRGEAENSGNRRRNGGRGRGSRGRGRMHSGRGGRSGRGDYCTFANQPPPQPQPVHWPHFPPPPQAPIPPNQPYLGPGTSLRAALPHMTPPTENNDTTTTDAGEFTPVDGKHSYSPSKTAKDPESTPKTNNKSTNRFDPLSTTSESVTTVEPASTVVNESPKRGPKKRKSKQTRKSKGEDHFTEAMEQAREGGNTADRGEPNRRSDEDSRQRKGKGARKPTSDNQRLSPNPTMIRAPTEEQARAYGAIVGKSTVSWDDLEDVIRVDGWDAAMSLLIALALVGNGKGVPPGTTIHRCDPEKAYLYLLGENQVNLMKMFNNEEYGNLKRKVINEWNNTSTTGLRRSRPCQVPKVVLNLPTQRMAAKPL
mmetsp:Transcript_13024/g.28547  ORF Transcript_13024/g.28547 Transcript_13024/m.28547 type:complete len:397 (-) Transcript_13024:65-1255(-)